MAFFFTASKKPWNFLCFDLKKSLFSQILLKLWLIGNRTSCRRIWSVIILVIKQIGLPLRGRPILLITRMITDRTGLHSVLLSLLIIIIIIFIILIVRMKCQQLWLLWVLKLVIKYALAGIRYVNWIFPLEKSAGYKLHLEWISSTIFA